MDIAFDIPLFHIVMTEPKGRPRDGRPTIVANPADDRGFVAFVERCVAAARDPGELQAALRIEYPTAVVRRRELSDERLEVWYVYRDGHWVAGRSPR